MQRLLVLLVLGAIAFTLNGCGSSNITSTSETSTENQLLLNIQKILKAGIPPTETDFLDSRTLYHLLARKGIDNKHFGSYKYQGEWGLLDHIILSGSLLMPGSPLYTTEEKAGVFRAPFLLTEDRKYGDEQPFRTYYGMKYQGGYSDHLPVWAEFRLLY